MPRAGGAGGPNHDALPWRIGLPATVPENVDRCKPFERQGLWHRPVAVEDLQRRQAGGKGPSHVG